MIVNRANELVFSVASIWEIGIKQQMGLPDFHADPGVVRNALFENGYTELDIAGRHVLSGASLPPIHKDPFDRILIAQAMIEGVILLTVDPVIARYPGPIRKV
jgi:PIN domain nuclease of toxin-antitoxin system